ncbi:hypothetical protein CNECB9_820003 [Cupriavidus necator]|uniref:Uncharacterized protein n=1 Tax=Cupriavidus necator TaxID=106590 RepID=A0A1K0IS24_CUPNE|nr:hypothetical protein CNECB9_820003 [Cupriavidus necator]
MRSQNSPTVFTDEPLLWKLARYRRAQGLPPNPLTGETRPLLPPLIGREKAMSREALHLGLNGRPMDNHWGLTSAA